MASLAGIRLAEAEAITLDHFSWQLPLGVAGSRFAGSEPVGSAATGTPGHLVASDYNQRPNREPAKPPKGAEAGYH
jgi:hypothetical protein